MVVTHGQRNRRTKKARNARLKADTRHSVTRGGRHTRGESFRAHCRLQKLVRLIARASRLIIERMVIS
ncbi:Uncharacterized protein FWK35_00031890, partial [Aphis craccivora]